MSMSVIPLLYDKENAKPLHADGELDKLLKKVSRSIGSDIYSLVYPNVLTLALTDEELEDLEHDPVYKSSTAGEYILRSEKFPQEFKDFIRSDIETDSESEGFEYAII